MTSYTAVSTDIAKTVFNFFLTRLGNIIIIVVVASSTGSSIQVISPVYNHSPKDGMVWYSRV